MSDFIDYKLAIGNLVVNGIQTSFDKKTQSLVDKESNFIVYCFKDGTTYKVKRSLINDFIEQKILKHKKETPFYKHDCKKCIFLGNYSDPDYEKVDLYYCYQEVIKEPTVIARISDNGSEYLSGMLFADRNLLKPLVEAKQRAILFNLEV